jgi:hypothetical protein
MVAALHRGAAIATAVERFGDPTAIVDCPDRIRSFSRSSIEAHRIIASYTKTTPVASSESIDAAQVYKP